jgi:hypothetical protein
MSKEQLMQQMAMQDVQEKLVFVLQLLDLVLQI